MKQTKGFDLIGDIHGYAYELKGLLGTLGYMEEKGTYRHPEGRKVIFLGDYIDKGPHVRETLRVVKGMAEAGEALAIMGNHEYNALTYHTQDGKGGWLRSHNQVHNNQHSDTLKQVVEPHPEEWREYLDWFSRLPLFLDLGDLRVAHAGWESGLAERLKGIARLDEATLREMNDVKSPLNEVKQVFLNGPELRLPEGYGIEDHTGVKRNTMRCKWWTSMKGKTYREAIFPHSDKAPEVLIPEKEWEGLIPYSEDEVPIFFGHYAQPAKGTPEPLQRNVACLDHRIFEYGPLTAYLWGGEKELMKSNFISFRTEQKKSYDDSYFDLAHYIDRIHEVLEKPDLTPENREELLEEMGNAGMNLHMTDLFKDEYYELPLDE